MNFSLRRREFIRLREKGDYRELGLRLWIAISFLKGFPRQCAIRKWQSLSPVEKILCES